MEDLSLMLTRQPSKVMLKLNVMHNVLKVKVTWAGA